MTDPDDGKHAPPATVEQAREQVERTRTDLTETLEDLTDKLDVKKQAKAKAHDLRDKVHESTSTLTNAAGKAHDALPAPVRQGIDSTAQTARPLITNAATQAKSHRGPLALAGVAGLFALIIVRRRRRL
jgi:MYXO-CTERM domain-containing protein